MVNAFHLIYLLLQIISWDKSSSTLSLQFSMSDSYWKTYSLMESISMLSHITSDNLLDCTCVLDLTSTEIPFSFLLPLFSCVKKNLSPSLRILNCFAMMHAKVAPTILSSARDYRVVGSCELLGNKGGKNKRFVVIQNL